MPVGALERPRRAGNGWVARPVRVGAVVDGDVGTQLDAVGADPSWCHDLAAALVLLARGGLWESLSDHGGRHRLSMEAITVGAFHVFVTPDDFDPAVLDSSCTPPISGPTVS